MLCPTPMEVMLDANGRPYFLWDLDMTLERFLELLEDPDPEVRGYTMGKLMRQAKPDDVFLFLTLGQIRDSWVHLEKHLGKKAEFWQWLLAQWESDDKGK